MDDETDARDREAFQPPRPYWVTDEEYEAIREKHEQELLEAGWRRFREAVESDGTDPSDEWLADLVAEGLEGVPEDMKDWLIRYMARSEGRQGGSPKSRPDNLHVPDDELYSSIGGLPPAKAFDVWRFRKRWARYRAFDTAPSRTYPPKREALKRTAEKLKGVSRDTLETWHRQAADFYGPDID